MIRNIKETFPPKTEMQKAPSCKIQGMSERSEMHAALLHAAGGYSLLLSEMV